MRNTMKQAAEGYKERFGWTGWQSGMLRDGRHGFYHLPRWVDNVQFLGEHLALRAQNKCVQCRMPQPRPFAAHTHNATHKMDCYHNWRIRDDLLQLCPPVHAWLVRRQAEQEALVPPEFAREYWKTYYLAKVLPTPLLARYLRWVSEQEHKS